MKAIRERLSRLGDLLRVKHFKIGWQYRRFRRFDRIADHAHARALDARAAADLLRADGDLEAANRKDRVARRRQRKAKKYRDLAMVKIGRIKVLKRHVLKLDRLVEKAEADLEEERKKNKVTIQLNQNKVTGGTPKARFRTACIVSSRRCGAGKRINFYDQSGTPSVDRCFEGEDYDQRSDCSQWLTSAIWTAGLPNPNGDQWLGIMYTGSLVNPQNGWHQCSEEEMRRAGFGYVVYGGGTGFHVEAYIGPADLTIGHGSAPIDAGVIDLLGDGNFRCYTYN